MSLKIQNKNITLELYKKYTNQEFLKWDEKYFSIILTFEREYFYKPFTKW